MAVTKHVCSYKIRNTKDNSLVPPSLTYHFVMTCFNVAAQTQLHLHPDFRKNCLIEYGGEAAISKHSIPSYHPSSPQKKIKISINEPNTTCHPSIMLLTFTLAFAVRAVKSTLPDEMWSLIMESTPDRGLGTLSRVRQRMHKLAEQKMMERKHEAQLVNELIRFHGIARDADPSLDPYFMENASKGIGHYLNGFAAQMYDWLNMFHSKSNQAVQEEIEKFATKLAHHRAKYPHPAPHRRANQKKMPKFDAYIKMRDENMELLQKKGISLMIGNYFVAGELFSDQAAIERMMGLMETIAILIGYPGVQSMQEEAGYFSVPWYIKEFVPELLDGTADVSVCPSNLEQVLRRDSCIGSDATDQIMENVREFIKIYRGLQ